MVQVFFVFFLRSYEWFEALSEAKLLGGPPAVRAPKLPDPQNWTLILYKYIKYKEARAVAKSPFEPILDLSVILFWWLDFIYLSVSKSRLCSSHES